MLSDVPDLLPLTLPLPLFLIPFVPYSYGVIYEGGAYCCPTGQQLTQDGLTCCSPGQTAQG